MPQADIQMTPGDRNPRRYGKKHAISAAVLALILAGASQTDILDQVLTEREAQRMVSYRDGRGIWTICKGLTTYQGKPVHANMHLTKAQCDEADKAFERQDFAEAEALVDPHVWAGLSPAARAGVADFIHNLGKGKARNSTFIRELNAGHRNNACAAITLWIKDQGRDCRKAGSNCQGQPGRRMMEDELCLTGSAP